MQQTRIDPISPKKRSWNDADEESGEDSDYTRKACAMPFHFHLVDIPGGHPAAPQVAKYVIDSSVRRLMKAHRTKTSSTKSSSSGKKKRSKSNSSSGSSSGSGGGGGGSSSRGVADVGSVIVVETAANGAFSRPRGRAPAQKEWDSARGVWVDQSAAPVAANADVMLQANVVSIPFHWHLSSANKRKLANGGAAAAAADPGVAVKLEANAGGNNDVAVGNVLAATPLPSSQAEWLASSFESNAETEHRKPVSAVTSAAKVAAKVALRDAAVAATEAATAAATASRATEKLLAVTSAAANTAAAAAAASSIKMELVEDDVVVPSIYEGAVNCCGSSAAAAAAAVAIGAGAGAGAGSSTNAGVAAAAGTSAGMGSGKCARDAGAVSTHAKKFASVSLKAAETVVGTVSVVEASKKPEPKQNPKHEHPSFPPASVAGGGAAAAAVVAAASGPDTTLASLTVAAAASSPTARGEDLLQTVRSPRLSKKAAKRADDIDEDLQMAIALSASLQTAGIASVPPSDMNGAYIQASSADGGGGGEGGGAAVVDGTVTLNNGTNEIIVPAGEEEPHSHDPYSAYLAELFCERCGRLDNEAEMLICDDCDQGFHMFCLVPPLKKIPRGDWRCPQCVSKKVEKPPAEFGFDMSEKEFSLRTFKKQAEDFKKKYFKEANPSMHRIETEFWRLVTTGVDNDEHVKVFYGADLFTEEHGSGFPVAGERHKNTISEKLDDSATEEMRESPWNLNNLPVAPRSLLRYVPGDVAGMKIPWAYAGMCFSSFCWHNEDQWTYSVNYNHVGAPKTWYGIPGGAAEQFEDAIRAAAPELFANQPNLLQHLVTLISPAALQEANVPVVRTDQHAGEFVVTFPRAYHGGYNAGFNLAEAVNFSTSDWLPLGRECQVLYNGMKRRPVFSQEEMVVALARDCASEDSVQRLGLGILHGALVELRLIIDAESELRRGVKAAGITDLKRVDFGSRDDDERICNVCSTTCYLSAVNCPCQPAVLACLHHLDALCKCPAHRATLLYQIKIPELAALIVPIELHWERFERWRATVEAYVNPVPAQPHPQQSWYSKGALKPPTEIPPPKLSELAALSTTGLVEGWDDQQIYHDLQSMIAVSKALLVESKSILSIVRPSYRLTTKRTEGILPHGGCTLDDLQGLILRVSRHKCEIEKKAKLEELLESALKLDALSREQAADADASIDALEDLQTEVDTCKVRLPDAARELFATLSLRKWTAKALAMEQKAKVPHKHVVALIKEGRALLKTGQQVSQLILQFEAEVEECDAWCAKADIMTQGLPDIDILEMLQQKVNRIETAESHAIDARLAKAHEWNETAADIINRAGSVRTVSKAKANAQAAKEPVAEPRPKKYELQREQRIQENKAMMLSLGLASGGGGGASAGGDGSGTLEPAEQHQHPSGAENRSASPTSPVAAAAAAAAAPPLPTVAELVKLVSRAKSVQVKLPILRSVETRLEQCVNWQSKLAHLFVGKDGKRPMWGRLLTIPDVEDVDRVRALRKVHGAKSESAKFCLCKKETSGFMICCEVCEDWFHGSCVGITERASKKSDARRFICKNCCRSRRPKPELVDRLVKAASLLNIRLPEVPLLETYAAAVQAWGDRVGVALTKRTGVALGKSIGSAYSLETMKDLLLEGDLLEMTTGGPHKQQLVERIASLSRFAEQGSDKLYCTCRRKATPDEAMIQCDSCEGTCFIQRQRAG